MKKDDPKSAHATNSYLLRHIASGSASARLVQLNFNIFLLHYISATDSADNATCCCSCYFTTGLSGMSLDTCGACTASDCPLNRNPYATQNTTTPAGEDIAKGTPQTVPGSQYPDRVQTRESFQAEERLTEVRNLIMLPCKVKRSNC